MNIYLIGYRCTGKTSVGRLLADRLGWDFADTDAMVEARMGKRIAEIVAQNGWQAFRERERRAVRDLAAGSRQVAATGGGAPCDKESRRVMRGNGVVVWLRAEPTVIENRLRADQDSAQLRPALNGGDAATEIQQILAQREPIYRAAMHFDVSTDNISPEEVTMAIVRALEKFGYMA